MSKDTAESAVRAEHGGGGVSDGWRQEALQLRKNHAEECAEMAALVELFEATLPSVKDGRKEKSLAVFCLALHHVSMRFRTHAGAKAIKIMLAAECSDLPETIYPKDRLIDVGAEPSAERKEV